MEAQAESTGAPTARAQMLYKPRDILLYLFSLLLVIAAATLAFPDRWTTGLLSAACLYFVVIFLAKRGGELDASSLAVICEGVWQYPRRVLRLVWMQRQRLLLGVLAFGVALCVEAGLRMASNGETLLLRPFPYMMVFLVHFSTLTLYRTAILVGHLLRMPSIREILSGSAWQRELRRLSLTNHLVHGYLTGIVSHLCFWLAPLFLWRFSPPTYAREVILFLGMLLEKGVVARSAQKTPRVSTAEAAVTTYDARDIYYATHEEGHVSRFYFTVFHGHHHDAIPSAMIAAGDTGFVEAIDRSIHEGWFLYGASGMGLWLSMLVFGDMKIHQYIPGAFPFSDSVLRVGAHHMVHHYGSLRPLGIFGDPRDLSNGYNPNNFRVRWYLDVVRKVEKLDAQRYEEACRRFQDFNARG